MPTCLKTETPRKPRANHSREVCHVNTNLPGEDVVLKLRDKAGTRTDGYKPVLSNLRWDTARPKLAGRFENRAVEAKIVNFRRSFAEFEEGMCTKWCLQ